MIHLVYPFDPTRIAAPWSIGNNVAAGLRAAGYAVAQYDWKDRRTITPSPGDVLLGHPHPEPGYVFRNSLHGWRKRIAMTPWNGSPAVERRLGEMSLDALIAICGPYWAARPPNVSAPVIAVDMAVDASQFPPRPARESPTGRRRLLYMGCAGADKGTDWLEAVIRLTHGFHWAHMGYGQVRGCIECGYVPVESPCWRHEVDDYDFIVCPGRHDANPTVALEGALCGLVPLCTPTSGWDCWPLLPLDPVAAAGELHRWQMEPLEEHQRKCRATAEGYTWERFMVPILEAVR